MKYQYLSSVYSTGEFQALQLIVFVVFVAVELPPASCMLVHILEIQFEMIVGVEVWHNGEQNCHCFCYIYLYASQYDTFSFTLILCLK